MNKTLDNFSDKFTAIVSKVSANRLLLVLRDTFVLVASLTLIAGFTVMISSVFLDPNGIIFGDSGLNLGKIIYGSTDSFLESGLASGLLQGQNICNFFSKGSMSINALLIVVVFSYNLSKQFFRKNKEHMVSVLYALAAFCICLPWDFSVDVDGTSVQVSNIINSNFLGQQGIFAGLIISGVAVYLYNKLAQKNITIKMPASVPPAVARSFESLIPGLITLLIFIIATVLSNTFANQSLPELFLSLLQQPAMAISKTAAFGLVSQITWPLFQWFGIHPTSIWGPIFGMTWDIAGNENVLGTAQHMYTTLFMNFSTIAAGTFALAPVLAVLIFSKVKHNKQVTKIALAPALFNVSEPITFGLPIIMNPIYFVPFVVVQPLCFYIAVFFTQIGFIDVISNNVPWTVPPILSGLLYSGSINGAIVQLINLVVATAIYIPFVKIADSMELKKQTNSDEDK